MTVLRRPLQLVQIDYLLEYQPTATRKDPWTSRHGLGTGFAGIIHARLLPEFRSSRARVGEKCQEMGKFGKGRPAV